ncbi:MAG: hypothetical protein ABII13_04135 [Patescibacteria group bacterium]|nr:hypothetical protein [Patescibacteria group bacterium]MBU2509619.1 hypothetical protein [Patescibacteria group bacterium]
MNRRNKFFLLILLALLVLAIGLYILFQPLFERAAQPPDLPGGATPGAFVPETPPTPIKTAPAIPADIKQLSDRAAAFVERLGSGSNSEGFRGYEDVMLDAAPKFRQTLQQEQEIMVQTHPVLGPVYGVIARVVSVDNSQAKSGADIVPFILQTQIAEDVGDPGKPFKISYIEVTLSFEKQVDGSYLVNGLSRKPLEL